MLSNRLVSIDFEISSTCQAKCPVCIRNVKGKLGEFEQTTKTLAEVKYILGDLAKQLHKIEFCGNYGDPMACEEIAEICKWLIEQSPNIRIDIATNGAIGSPKTYAKLGELGANIIFAFDGTTQESNELYRRNVKWSDAMLNLKAYSETSVAPYSTWQFLVFDENKEHLEPAIQIAIDHNIKYFFINDFPNPFVSGYHSTLIDRENLIAKDGQVLKIYDTDQSTVLYTLTQAVTMSEKIKELKEKYATKMLFL